MTTTFQKARDGLLFIKAALRSQHTRDAYTRAIDLFMAYLNDRSFPDQLPVQAQLKAIGG